MKLQGGVCLTCIRKIGRGDKYFRCETLPCLPTAICYECGSNKRHLALGHNNTWNESLCGCTKDMGYCADSIFCHHCLILQFHCTTTNGLPTDGKEPAFSCFGCNDRQQPLCNECLIFASFDLVTLGLWSACCLCQQRQLIQRTYGIHGADAEGDYSACCKSIFCRWCSAAQIGRERASRGHWLGGVYFTKPPSGWVAPQPTRPMAAPEQVPYPSHSAAPGWGEPFSDPWGSGPAPAAYPPPPNSHNPQVMAQPGFY
jgi:Cys-rich protein (TIGR01571 family)